MEKYISKSEIVKKRGWYKWAIPQFLGEPDLIIKAPNSRSDIKKYLVSRVDEVESQEWFHSTYIQTNKTQEIRMIQRVVNALSVEILHIKSKESMHIFACRWYNRGSTSSNIVSLDSNESYLNEISVDVLLETATYNTDELINLENLVGFDESDLYITSRTLDEIAKLHPFLRDECNKRRVEIPKDNEV